MKNEPSLYNDYVLATLIGALIFAAGYFVRDFNSINSMYHASPIMQSDSVSASVPPPPSAVPPAPPVSAIDAVKNAASVMESMDQE